MKLSPKLASFCPGCNHNKLELQKVPQLIIEEEKEPTKNITILNSKKKKVKGGLF